MEDREKAKEQLLEELERLRQRIAELEASEAGRKRAEEALQESEEHYRSMVESIDLGINLIDCDHNIVMVNAAQSRHFNKPPREMVGRKCFQEFEKRDAVCPYCPGVQAIATGQSAEVETHGVRDDGSRFDVRLRAFPVFGQDGAARGFIEIGQDITERKQVEEALRASEERFALAVQGSNDGIWDWDILNNSLYWSPRLKELLGYADDELDVGFDTFESHLHPDDKAPTNAAIEAHLRARVPYDVEERLRTKSGEYRWFRARGQAIWDEAGNPFRMVGFTTDITERKRVEEALAFEQHLSRTLLDSTPDHIYFKDAAGRFLRVSKALANWFHVSNPAEVLGKTDFDFFTEEHARPAYEDEQEVMRTGQPVVKEEKETWPDGRKTWVATTKMPLRDEAGNIVGTFGVSRDITERKQAEEALAEERNLLRTLIDNLPDYVYVKDPEGRFVMGNMTVVRQMGFSSLDELVGKSDFDLFPYEMAAQYYTAEQEIIKSGQGVYDYEGPTVDANKEEKNRWVSTTKVPLRDAQGKIVGFVGLGRDITERKAAEAERERLLAGLERRALQLQTAAEVSRAASSILDLDELIQQVVNLVRGRFALYYVGLFLLDEEHMFAVLRAGTGEAGRKMLEGRHRLKVGGRSMIGQCVAEAKARIALDVGKEAVRFNNPLLPKTRSEMALPLISRGQVVGAMTIQSTQAAAFSEEDITVLQTMADQAAIAIENAQLFTQTQQAAQHAQALYETSRALSFYLEEEPLIRTILEVVNRTLGCEYALISTVDEQTRTIGSKHGLWQGEFDVFPEWIAKSRYPLDHPDIIADICRTGRTEIIGEWDERFNREIWDKFGHERFLRIFMPIKMRDRVIGVIEVAYDKRRKNHIDEEEVNLLAAFMDQAAIAFENVGLYEKTQRQVQELAFLNEASRTMTSSLDLEQVLMAVMQKATDVLRVEAASILLLDDEGKELILRTVVGPQAQELKGLRLPLERGIAGWVARKGQPLLVADVREDPRFYADIDGVTGFVTRSILTVPLKVKGKVIGVIEAVNKTEGEFSQADLELLSSMTQSAAIAIENARLFEQGQQVSLMMSLRVRELACLNDIGRRMEETPPVPKFLQWVAERISSAMQHPDVCMAAIEFEGEIYGPAQAVSLPRQIVHALRIGGKVVGRVYIAYTEEYDFLDEESALLGDIVRRVSGYIESRHLLEETQTRAEELAVLNEMSRALTRMLDVDAVVESFYRYASRLIDTTNFYVALYHPEQNEVSFPFYAEGELRRRPERRRVGGGLTEYVIRTREPLLIEENVVTRLKELGIESIGQEAQSWLGVPMAIGDQVIGVIAAQSYTTPRLYNEHHRDLLIAIANQAAIAIENARLFEQMQTRAERERAIREITDQMQQATDLETLMRIAAEELNRVLGGSRAYVRLGTEAELIDRDGLGRKS